MNVAASTAATSAKTCGAVATKMMMIRNGTSAITSAIYLNPCTRSISTTAAAAAAAASTTTTTLGFPPNKQQKATIATTTTLPSFSFSTTTFTQKLSLDNNDKKWFSSTSSNDGKETEGGNSENAKKDEETTTEKSEETEKSSEPSFEEKLATLEDQVKMLKDQLLRSLAEQENTRQIAKRDVSAAKNYAIKSFAKSLLEVSDNLQRALDAVPEDSLNSSDAAAATTTTAATLKTLYEGVKMTNDGLTKVFASHGIKPYCQAPGDVFDPTKHQALMEYLDPSKQPGTVGQVIKVGFTLNDRVLRPAEVGVIKKP